MRHVAMPECQMRLDRYLRSLYPYLPQGAIEKAIRKKQITLEGTKCLASSRLAGGEVIHMPESLQLLARVKGPQVYTKATEALAKRLLGKSLIYEDEHIIAISKPNNLATQGGRGVKVSVDSALKYYNQVHGTGLRLVHRLDSPTSGIMLIAKDRSTATELGEAFKKREIKKLYLAITSNRPVKESGLISNETGISQYRLLRKLKNKAYLMAFAPKTGKMHQIRRHAKELGCPILGDTKYWENKELHAKHLMLHSCTISIPGYIKAGKHRFRAPFNWNEVTGDQ